MKNKGITLIALVITIIVLLILAGITINLTIGNDGILNMARKAKEDYIKAQLKEELETKILELEGEQIATSSDFYREELYKLSEIGANVEDVGIPAIGDYKGYDFSIDENNKVTIGNQITGARPKIILEKDTEELTNTITISVVVTTEEGTITLVTKPDGSTTTQTEFNYTITENGTYKFSAEASNGRIAVKKITIKNAKPAKPIIEATTEEYALLTDNPEVIAKQKNGNRIKITYEENENLIHYYSEDYGATWKEYQGEFDTLTTQIRAKSALETNANFYTETQKNLFADHAFGYYVVDGNTSTAGSFNYYPSEGERWYYLRIDPSCYGRTVELHMWRGTYCKIVHAFWDENWKALQSYDVVRI